MQKGSGYLASENLQTSVAGQQIIPNPPSNWSMGYHLYKFSFMNVDQDCHVLMNDNPTQKYLVAGMGVNVDQIDAPIYSFKILEDGIKFCWFGAY